MAESEKSRIYPDEWSDDQVMNVLFSPFRGSRDVNPPSWDQKMRFWTDMIRRHCVATNTLVFSARELPPCFERSGKLPVCMSIVLQNLIRLCVAKTFEVSVIFTWLIYHLYIYKWGLTVR